MKNIIEYEVCRYRQRLVECYDEEGLLCHYPVRKPMQCMVLKALADKLSWESIYSREEILGIISSSASVEGSFILNELIEYKFVNSSADGKYFGLNRDYQSRYLEFLGLF